MEARVCSDRGDAGFRKLDANRSVVEVEVIDNSDKRDVYVPALLEKRGVNVESEGRGDGEGVRKLQTSDSSDGC